MTQRPGPPLDVLRRIFQAAPFIASLGIELEAVAKALVTLAIVTPGRTDAGAV